MLKKWLGTFVLGFATIFCACGELPDESEEVGLEMETIEGEADTVATQQQAIVVTPQRYSSYGSHPAHTYARPSHGWRPGFNPGGRPGTPPGYIPGVGPNDIGPGNGWRHGYPGGLPYIPGVGPNDIAPGNGNNGCIPGTGIPGLGCSGNGSWSGSNNGSRGSYFPGAGRNNGRHGSVHRN
jgi:hypothetical protein